jgi:hypothetical protein
MLLIASAVKLVSEIALLALVGQGLLGLLAGKKRDTNLIYQMFQVVTGPVVRAARFITPRIVIDRHMPIVTLCLLVFTWLAATGLKVSLCLEAGVQACR